MAEAHREGARKVTWTISILLGCAVVFIVVGGVAVGIAVGRGIDRL